MGKSLDFKPFLNIWYLRPVRIKNAVRELIQKGLEMKCEHFVAGSRLAFGCHRLTSARRMNSWQVDLGGKMIMFREMRRNIQQLSEQDCIRILTSERRCVLSVNGTDGFPYGMPMNFLYENGKIFFHGAKEGYKID